MMAVVPAKSDAAPQENRSEPARRSDLDALRGLAIILVVLFHAISLRVFRSSNSTSDSGLFYNYVLRAIDAFQMPLFAFVSGFVAFPLRDRSFWAELRLRFRHLMVPYLAWVTLAWLVWPRLSWPWTPGAPSGLLTVLLNSTFSGHAFPSNLWYLWASFVSLTIFSAVVRSRRPKLFFLLSLIALATAGLLFFPIRADLASVLWLYPFMVVGYLAAYRPWGAEGGRGRRYLMAMSAAVFIALVFGAYPAAHIYMANASGSVEIIISKLIKQVLRYVPAIAGVAFFWNLYSRKSGWVIKVQQYIGKKTLGVYVSSTFFMVLAYRAGLTNVLGLSVFGLGGGGSSDHCYLGTCSLCGPDISWTQLAKNG